MVDFLPFHLYFCIYISALSNRLKEGIQIKSSERISITSDEGTSVYKLKIKETLAEDEGLYSLVAVNKEGETRGDIQLSVHCNVFRFLVYFKRNSLIRFLHSRAADFHRDAKELLCQGWRDGQIRRLRPGYSSAGRFLAQGRRATGRDGPHQNGERQGRKILSDHFRRPGIRLCRGTDV